MIRLALALYNLAWIVLLPFLKRSSRISLGWPQRTLKHNPSGPFDLWIQAASGGESLLTNMVLEELVEHLPNSRKYRVLVTSGTKQGIDSLEKGRTQLENSQNFDIEIAYFPFDAPGLMAKAFKMYAPQLAVIVETELWPGFLYHARQTKTPVLLINGRMSEKSHATYKYFSRFFTKYGPKNVWAISPLDGQRFAEVVGPGRVSSMDNIKFDRITPNVPQATENPIVALLPPTVPFVLLGSIRKEEEEKISQTIVQLLEKKPNITIGLFPKHIERADHWLTTLEELNVTCCKRSKISTTQAAGSVIVWDVFGELAGAYGLAKTTFVGGSLENLGGQNFLEPLVFGIKPIIGPYWKNFAWVSREIVDCGLVHEISTTEQLTMKLLEEISLDESRDRVINEVQNYFSPRKGGTRFISLQILKQLNSITK